MSNDTWAARSTNAFTDETVDQQIPLRLDKRIDLDVSNTDGHVTIRMTGEANLQLHSVKQGKTTTSHFADAALLVDVAGNHVKIAPQFPKFGISRVFGGGISFDITVELPEQIVQAVGARVRVNTASGPVDIEGIEGEISINTASGDMTLNRIAGEVSLRTSSGSARLTNPRGEIQARSASGDVIISGGQLQRVKTTSASGDMTITSAWTGDDSSRIETVSGDVTLDILESPDTKLTFSTVSGAAIVNPPFSHLEKRTWVLGDQQRHGPMIVVRTVSGDLRAGAQQATGDSAARPAAPPHAPAETSPIPARPGIPPAPPVPPIPPAPPRTHTGALIMDHPSVSDREIAGSAGTTASPARPAEGEDRLSVLQAVERGELDIEDALDRLDGMDEPREPEAVSEPEPEP